jgi:Ion channel
MNKKNIPPEFGFITLVAANFFRWLQKISPSNFLIGNRIDAFNKSDFANLTDADKRKATIKRARKVDIYILACLTVEIGCVVMISFGLARYSLARYTILILAVLRLIDIIQVNINLSLFDVLRVGKEFNYMASVVRSIINVIINYFEIILCFGIIYSVNQKYLTDVIQWTDAFYYSAVTQITVGFGQSMPHEYVKLLTVLQFLLGYFFTALIIGRFIGLLPQNRTIARDGQSDRND